ncbi:unnamed protein product [Ectocarpus sp. CCAP 1310/34]|nr:unnamed protein product [Ectocarpus sp. CCAP 1310/34]
MNGCNTEGRRRIRTVLVGTIVSLATQESNVFPVKYCPKPSHCINVEEYLIRTERWYDQRIDLAGHASQPNNERNGS